MTRKRDIKQFRQAGKEAGLTVSERYEQVKRCTPTRNRAGAGNGT